MQQGKRTKKNLTKNELQPPAHTVKIFGLRGRDWISSYRELDERETHRPDITLHAVVSALKPKVIQNFITCLIHALYMPYTNA